MLDLNALTDEDKGRAVRYSTGHTSLAGWLDSWDGDLAYVKFSGGTFARIRDGKRGKDSVSMDPAVAVPTDPANLEFA